VLTLHKSWQKSKISLSSYSRLASEGATLSFFFFLPPYVFARVPYQSQ
jgi:hypothetical protein